jgi:FkbM family methyltransferase
MKQVSINDRWDLWVPTHRANRPEWPWWEATRLAAMSHFIEPLDVVYDIGAEEGDFPALFATWGAKVMLVEPNPKVWPNIKAIFEANDLQEMILGSFVGFASDVTADATVVDGPMHQEAIIRGSAWPECADGAVIGDHGFRHLAEETDTTPQMTIDRMVSLWNFEPPNHITMDVEGSEMRVLKGAEATIQAFRPYVWISIHADAMRTMYGNDPQEISAFFRLLNYEEIFLSYDHESHYLFIPTEMCWVL